MWSDAGKSWQAEFATTALKVFVDSLTLIWNYFSGVNFCVWKKLTRNISQANLKTSYHRIKLSTIQH